MLQYVRVMTGFGADIGKELVPDVLEDHTSRTPQDALLEYMVRAPVAVSRITQGANDKIIYKADHIHPRHGGSRRLRRPRRKEKPCGARRQQTRLRA